MKNAPDLKPCPFCGCQLEHHANVVGEWCWSVHPGNDCYLAIADDGDRCVVGHERGSVEEWNRRASDRLDEEGR